MKINITEAVEALQSDPSIRKGYASIQIELTRDAEGNDELEWKIYAGDNKTGKNE
jgi:hypothetical protein